MSSNRRRMFLIAGWLLSLLVVAQAPARQAVAQSLVAPTEVRVQATAATPQRQSFDVAVQWRGIDDTSTDYEIERAIRRNDSVEPFIPMSRAWAPDRRADGTFAILDSGAFEASFDGWMCYRVRAVKGSAAGPYSTEACIAGPLAKGAPSTAAAPLPTSPPALRDFPPPPVDPLNPLEVRYATLQGYSGPEPNWARPNLAGATVLQGETAIRETIPAAAFLEPGDAEGFTIMEAQARYAPDGRFDAFVYYEAVEYQRYFQRRTITLSSWTMEGDFLYVGYSSSPVHITRQTTINGLYALTTMPTPAIFEGRDTREVIFTTGDRIYDLRAENYTEDQPVLDIAARLARRYASVPAAPATGNAEPAANGRGSSWLALGELVTMAGAIVLLGVGIALARRR